MTAIVDANSITISDVAVAGQSAYVYIAWASSSSGTDFTMTFDAALDYIAIKSTTTPITSPSASTFTGLWKKYKGEVGATGAPGGDANHWAIQETPTGTMDGSNKSFTVAHTPTGIVELWWGSGLGLVYMVYGVDYTYSGTAVTLITFAPDAAKGEYLRARYPYA